MRSPTRHLGKASFRLVFILISCICAAFLRTDLFVHTYTPVLAHLLQELQFGPINLCETAENMSVTLKVPEEYG